MSNFGVAKRLSVALAVVWMFCHSVKAETFHCGGLFSSKSCEVKNCGAGQRPKNWCSFAVGFVTRADCECEADPGYRPPPSSQCKIPDRSQNIGCGGSMILQGMRGCEVACYGQQMAECRDFTRPGTTLNLPVCFCR